MTRTAPTTSPPRTTRSAGRASSPLGTRERAFLAQAPRSLARVATVGSDGEPHVVPVGWNWDEHAGEIVLGGHNVPRTQRARDVRHNGRVALTIDGVADAERWAPWALLLRGEARVDEERGVILLRPDWVRAWGLESRMPDLET